MLQSPDVAVKTLTRPDVQHHGEGELRSAREEGGIGSAAKQWALVACHSQDIAGYDRRAENQEFLVGLRL